MNLIEYIAQKAPQFNDLYINNIVLCKSEYSVIIGFLSKKVYNAEEKEQIRRLVTEIVPTSFSVKEINYSKLYCDEQIAVDELKKYLYKVFPSVNSAVINLECKSSDSCFTISALLDENIKNYYESNSIREKIENVLTVKFKESFHVEETFSASDISVSQTEETTLSIETECNANFERYIEVLNSTSLIGKTINEPAGYIADCETEGKVVICGKVKYLNEKTTKNGKQLISFYLEDFTGKIFCISFPNTSNYTKIKKLANDSEIIIQGELKHDTYRGNIVCMVKNVSFCELPKNFVLKEKKSKPEPPNYSVVIPQKLELTSQANIFDNFDNKIPDFFKGKRFVVFDIETTGLNYDIDKITEIGAILIDDGVISHSFSTLINPKIHIKEDTVRLNGIDDNLVKNSPLIEMVIPDFYKFTRNCYLVAQNIDFDLKFMKYNAKAYGYFFENCFYDTLEMARGKLAGRGLSNYKLDTLCKYFNIDLIDHHRAWNDALATAKLFIKLVGIDDK